MKIIFFEYMQQPRFWIARDDDGYWLVPAKEQGWHERSPFVGHVTNLIPLKDFDGIDLGILYVGDAGVWEHNANCPGAESPVQGCDAALERVFDHVELKETCFSGDTYVHMENGEFKKIKYVAVGDKVLSRCEITGEMAYKKVIEKFHHEGSDDAFHDYEIPAVLVYYATNSLDQNHEGLLHVTPEHPVWVKGKGWTAVRDIQLGDVLLGADGAEPYVERIDTDGSTYNVYNLHVEDFHTYFVSSGVWVHNQKISELRSVKRLEEVRNTPAFQEKPALRGEKSLN